MNFSKYKKASDYKVEEWLVQKLDLHPYQKERMHRDEIIRFSKFEFYEKRQEEKISPLWRSTLILFPIYWLLLFVGLPFTMLTTGKWGYGKTMMNFHYNWCNKLGV